MLLTILLAAGLSVLVAGGLWFCLVQAMRRPAIARRMVRVPPLRWAMARMAATGMRAARRRAERDGTIPAGRPVSDLEVALSVADTDEARHARAMLARMSPRQRAELSRRTMGADGVAGLLESAAATAAVDAEALGRADRRRVAGSAPATDAGRQAQHRKAVARRRAARKAARR